MKTFGKRKMNLPKSSRLSESSHKKDLDSDNIAKIIEGVLDTDTDTDSENLVKQAEKEYLKPSRPKSTKNINRSKEENDFGPYDTNELIEEELEPEDVEDEEDIERVDEETEDTEIDKNIGNKEIKRLQRSILERSDLSDSEATIQENVNRKNISSFMGMFKDTKKYSDTSSDDLDSDSDKHMSRSKKSKPKSNETKKKHKQKRQQDLSETSSFDDENDNTNVNKKQQKKILDMLPEGYSGPLPEKFFHMLNGNQMGQMPQVSGMVALLMV